MGDDVGDGVGVRCDVDLASCLSPTTTFARCLCYRSCLSLSHGGTTSANRVPPWPGAPSVAQSSA